LPIVSNDATAVPEVEVEHYTITGSSGALSDPKVHLVYFQTGGSVSLSWRVETDVNDNWLLSYVDAISADKVFGVVDYVAEASYTV
jgi:extracellular elastinolytic metalloproteinase